MRIITCFGLSVLLSGCAASTVNYYTQTIDSWRGGSAKNLVQRWGLPDQKLIIPGGNTMYVYSTQSFRLTNPPASPPIGVNFSPNGRPVIVPMNGWQPNGGRGPAPLCWAIFEANPKGVIIRTQIQGAGCYGGENFAAAKSNPERK